MKGKKSLQTKLILLFGAATLAFGLGACAPAQDASHERVAYVADQAATLAAQGFASEETLLEGILPAEELRVEEYLNYYEQYFTAPQPPDALGLDISLGNTHVPAGGGEAWLQVGLQAEEPTYANRKPLNLVLVLDKSGSMSENDKITYLIQSLDVLVEQLQPEDRLAIVTYDSDTSLLLPSQAVGDKSLAKQAIHSIQTGTATNLHGGLMLGYQEVMKQYSTEASNQVILLTDGIANRGVTDPEQIARDSLAYNEEGIHLSVIGLGLDLNDRLLSTLAEQGKGNYHFISDPEEMERVFKDELASMVQTVATDIWLTLELQSQAQVKRVYGYEYTIEGSMMRVQFDDAGAGGNQILMVNLVIPAGEGTDQTLAKARLEYNDANGMERYKQEVVLSFSYGAPEPYEPLVAPSVRRNATVLRMAEALQQVSYLCNGRQYTEALRLVEDTKSAVWKVGTQESDEQMLEDLKVLESYEAILQDLIVVSSATPLPTVVYIVEERPQSNYGCYSALLVMGFGLVGLVYLRRTAIRKENDQR